MFCCVFFFQAEDGIRDYDVTGVQTCALPIWAEFQWPDFGLADGVFDIYTANLDQRGSKWLAGSRDGLADHRCTQ
mgnify:CR=1 FL=1